VNVAGLVTVQLPDVTLWIREPGSQPTTGLERAIFIKDIGGNAGAFPITVLPFGSQAIDLLPQLVIVQNRQIVRLYPFTEITGWISA
jgi:hypothetical protein